MRILLTLAVLLVSSIVTSPAVAHRPYYTVVEKICLPNGEAGEVALLNGDGGFGPDPVRAILIDRQGHRVARSPLTTSLSLYCEDLHRCLVVDLIGARVFEPQMDSFRYAPRQSEDKFDKAFWDWDLMEGEESWGFRVRGATRQELWLAHAAKADEYVAYVLAGALCGYLLVQTARVVRAPSHIALRLATTAGLTVIIGVLTLGSRWGNWMDGNPQRVWSVSFGFGVTLSIIAAAARAGFSRLRRA